MARWSTSHGRSVVPEPDDAFHAVENMASASLKYFRLPWEEAQLRRMALARISCDDLEKDVCAHSIVELFVAELAIPGLALRNPAQRLNVDVSVAISGLSSSI